MIDRSQSADLGNVRIRGDLGYPVFRTIGFRTRVVVWNFVFRVLCRYSVSTFERQECLVSQQHQASLVDFCIDQSKYRLGVTRKSQYLAMACPPSWLGSKVRLVGIYSTVSDVTFGWDV